MEITSKKIPHNYRNKYFRYTKSGMFLSLNRQSANEVVTRTTQDNESIANLQAQINELQAQINELQAITRGDGDGGGEVVDPTV